MSKMWKYNVYKRLKKEMLLRAFIRFLKHKNIYYDYVKALNATYHYPLYYLKESDIFEKFDNICGFARFEISWVCIYYMYFKKYTYTYHLLRFFKRKLSFLFNK